MIESATKEVEKEQERRRNSFGLKHMGNGKGLESSQLSCRLPARSFVLVYWSYSKTLEGPFKFIQTEDDPVVVQTSRGRKIFSSFCVKPLNRPKVEALQATISGESASLFGNEHIKDGDLYTKAYTSTQSTKLAERG